MNEIWGPELRFTTIKNTKPPAKPSTPTVSNYFGQLIINWDGLSADGSKYLPDLNRVEVHVGTTATFTPSDATMVDQFSTVAPGQRQASDLLFGTTYYAKLVAVNSAETRSEPSDEAHATIRRITDIEIEDGSISIDKTNFTSRGLRQTRQYNQPNPPSSTNNPGNPPHYSDTWFDSDDKYRFYVYDHATPFRAQGANESWEAYYDANDAANDLGWRVIPIGTADQVPGARVFFQSADPVGTANPAPVDGDIWYKTGGASGAIPYIRRSNAWTQLQFGQGTLGPGSIVGDNIVGNTITGDKITANTITSTQIATDGIIASNIQAGAITADKVGTNEIVAYSANIANGIIDSAKIDSLEAGKITTGSLAATISITSGLIRTGVSSNRAEIDSAGIRLYNSTGAVTFNASSSNGYVTMTGNIVARTFRSQGYQTGGNGYIELGDTGPTDPTDEMRMYYQNTVSSIRNPSDRPGFVRISTSDPGTRNYVGVYDFGPTFLTLPGSIGQLQGGSKIEFNNVSAFMEAKQGGFIKLTPAGNSLQALFIEGANNNAVLLRNGGPGFRRVSIKLPQDEERVQIRNGDDNGYGDLIVRNIQITGTQTGGSAGGSYPTNASFNNITTSGLTVYNTISAQGYTGGNVTGNYLYSTGDIRANNQLLAGGFIEAVLNISTTQGSFYSKGSFIGSNPEVKTGITELNIDALELLKEVKPHAWYWLDADGNPTKESNIGFLTSQLPYIVTPDAGDGNGDHYNTVTLDVVKVRAINQLREEVTALKERIATLEGN
jgi:hypothetical protein